jgi:hypothetical protein
MIKNIVVVALLLWVCQAKAQMFKQGFEAGFSTLSAYRVLSNGDGSGTADAIITSRNGAESPTTSFGFFAGYKHFFNQRFFGATGLRYSRLGYNTTFGLTFVSSPKNMSSIGQVKQTDVHNIISLPLTVGYAFVSKSKIEAFVKGGLLGDVVLNDHYLIKYKHANGSTEKTTAKDPFLSRRKVAVSFMLGIGTQVKLFPKGAFTCTLNMYQNLTALNSNPVRLRLNALMLDLGYVVAL